MLTQFANAGRHLRRPKSSIRGPAVAVAGISRKPDLADRQPPGWLPFKTPVSVPSPLRRAAASPKQNKTFAAEPQLPFDPGERMLSAVGTMESSVSKAGLD